MDLKPLKRLGTLAAAATIALALIGCRGEQGPQGPAGQNGSNGTNGSNGSNGTNGQNGQNGAPVVNAANLTADEWGQLTLKANITGASVVAGHPVVNFTVTDGQNTPVIGLGFTSRTSTAVAASLPAFGFTIAKLVPGAPAEHTGSYQPSQWVNYIVTTMPTTTTAAGASKPSTDSTGTLVDNGDGTYKYTFYRDITAAQATLDGLTYTGNYKRADLGDVTYDASLVHRVAVQIGGNARGTSTNTTDGSNSGVPAVPIRFAANATYDFVPATGAAAPASASRTITTLADCNACHTRLTVHGGNRFDPNYCSICHTDQRKYSYAEATTTASGYTGSTMKINGKAVGDFPQFIHRLHMGEGLAKTGYNYANVLFNEVHYPQDQRNCSNCHAGTKAAQGDNWNMVPSRFACGACHDSVDWIAGTNHKGGPASDDHLCASCHQPSDIKTYHVAVTAPDPNNVWNGGTNGNTNASFVAANVNNLPVGASVVTWDLKSVTLNASSQPVFTFRFVKDGTPVVFNTYAAGSVTELMDNFVGGPSVYAGFAVPQDGIAAPADYNATVSGYIKNIWNGTATGTGAGTMTGPDGAGYYTLTLTGVKIPATATMLTGGIGYTYGIPNTQPLTQTNVAGFPYNSDGKRQGGLSVPAPNVWKMFATSSTVTTAMVQPRRAIVSNAKCNACHQNLGVFTDHVFHAGQRNDAPTCTFCHTVNRVNSGWSVNAKDAVHAIHAAGKRVNKFSWEVGAGDKYWEVTYPAILNNCEACHVPGSYDFGASSNAAALPNLLMSTVATGTTPATISSIVTGNETVPGTYYSPFVAANTAYGTGFTTSFATAATTNYTDAQGTTLVVSPQAAACFSCHDTALAVAHMRSNGGTVYEQRAVALTRIEQCQLCHSAGKTADVRVVHTTFK